MKKMIGTLLLFLLMILITKIVYVKSNSMNPYFYSGDLIFITPSQSYKKGDVITFYLNKKTYVTHRIITQKNISGENYFETKGDANNTKDSLYVAQKNILGKVIFIIPTHKIINLIRSEEVEDPGRIEDLLSTGKGVTDSWKGGEKYEQMQSFIIFRRGSCGTSAS